MTTPSIDYLPADEGYRAGACNIGPEEIARRQRAAQAGLIATIVLGGSGYVAGEFLRLLHALIREC